MVVIAVLAAEEDRGELAVPLALLLSAETGFEIKVAGLDLGQVDAEEKRANEADDEGSSSSASSSSDEGSGDDSGTDEDDYGELDDLEADAKVVVILSEALFQDRALVRRAKALLASHIQHMFPISLRRPASMFKRRRKYGVVGERLSQMCLKMGLSVAPVSSRLTIGVAQATLQESQSFLVDSLMPVLLDEDADDGKKRDDGDDDSEDEEEAASERLEGRRHILSLFVKALPRIEQHLGVVIRNTRRHASSLLAFSRTIDSDGFEALLLDEDQTRTLPAGSDEESEEDDDRDEDNSDAVSHLTGQTSTAGTGDGEERNEATPSSATESTATAGGGGGTTGGAATGGDAETDNKSLRNAGSSAEPEVPSLHSEMVSPDSIGVTFDGESASTANQDDNDGNDEEDDEFDEQQQDDELKNGAAPFEEHVFKQEHVVQLLTHSDLREEVRINPAYFKLVRVGDILEIAQGHQAVILQVTSTQPVRGTLKISIQANIATLFGMRTRQDARVRVVRKEAVGLDYLELSFKDMYVSRSDMWRFKQIVQNHCVYKTKKIDLTGLRYTADMMLVNGVEVACGLVTPQTKLIFRSRSARLFWLIQISKESYEFANDGELFLEKQLGFLRILFNRFIAGETNHNLSVVLFSRTVYKRERHIVKEWDLQGEESVDVRHGFQEVTVGDRTLWCQDHYKVVRHTFTTVAHDKEKEQMARASLEQLISNIRQQILNYPYELKWGEADPATGLYSMPAPSADGNILEVINLCNGVYDKHHINRDLDRTGQNIIVLTAGTGLFWADRELYHMTKQRMVDNGIGCDMICVRRPPLHAVPLFAYNEEEKVRYIVPHWIQIKFFDHQDYRDAPFGHEVPFEDIEAHLSRLDENDADEDDLRRRRPIDALPRDRLFSELQGMFSFASEEHDSTGEPLVPYEVHPPLVKEINPRAMDLHDTAIFGKDKTTDAKLPLTIRKRLPNVDLRQVGSSPALRSLTEYPASKPRPRDGGALSNDSLGPSPTSLNNSPDAAAAAASRMPQRFNSTGLTTDVKQSSLGTASPRRTQTGGGRDRSASFHVPAGSLGALSPPVYTESSSYKTESMSFQQGKFVWEHLRKSDKNKTSGRADVVDILSTVQQALADKEHRIYHVGGQSQADTVPVRIEKIDYKEQTLAPAALAQPKKSFMNPFKVAPVSIKMTNNRRRWSHLFSTLDYLDDLTRLNWKSLITPAILPLTTDYTPDQSGHYMEYNHTLSVEETSANMSGFRTLDALEEVMCQRLAQDYQLVVSLMGDEHAPVTSTSLSSRSRSLKSPPSPQSKALSSMSASRRERRRKRGAAIASPHDHRGAGGGDDGSHGGGGSGSGPGSGPGAGGGGVAGGGSSGPGYGSGSGSDTTMIRRMGDGQGGASTYPTYTLSFFGEIHTIEYDAQLDCIKVKRKIRKEAPASVPPVIAKQKSGSPVFSGRRGSLPRSHTTGHMVEEMKAGIAGHEEEKQTYSYFLWSEHWGVYVATQRQATHGRDLFNWNSCDQLICGYHYDFDQQELRHRRKAYCILPRNWQSPRHTLPGERARLRRARTAEFLQLLGSVLGVSSSVTKRCIKQLKTAEDDFRVRELGITIRVKPLDGMVERKTTATAAVAAAGQASAPAPAPPAADADADATATAGGRPRAGADAHEHMPSQGFAVLRERHGFRKKKIKIRSADPDPRRYEWIVVRHDTEYDPDNCFQIEIQWLAASGVAVKSWVSKALATRADANLTVVMIPCYQKLLVSDPFHTPLPVAVSRSGRGAVCDFLTNRLGFIPDGNHSEWRKQFLHHTGNALVRVTPTGFEWINNDLVSSADLYERSIEDFRVFRRFCLRVQRTVSLIQDIVQNACAHADDAEDKAIFDTLFADPTVEEVSNLSRAAVHEEAVDE